MPQFAVCSKCAFKYLKKHNEWPTDEKYKAVYRKEIIGRDDATDINIAIISKYWYMYSSRMNDSGEREWVNSYKACERCARHDENVAKLMDHAPYGWLEATKSDALSDSCTIQ
jgi:hypothetical protein